MFHCYSAMVMSVRMPCHATYPWFAETCNSNIAEVKLSKGTVFSSSNYQLADSSLPQCEQCSPTDPGEPNANVDQMYRVTD